MLVKAGMTASMNIYDFDCVYVLYTDCVCVCVCVTVCVCVSVCV